MDKVRPVNRDVNISPEAIAARIAWLRLEPWDGDWSEEQRAGSHVAADMLAALSQVIDNFHKRDIAQCREIQRLRAKQDRLVAEKVEPPASYQSRADTWLHACFGAEIARDKTERNHRFLEEALELVQSAGCTQSEAHQLVDYVYDRDVGEMGQEIGGVMNTLAALCLAHGFDMDAEAETELARCWTKIEKIRAKQAAKPKHSPLPE